MFLGENIIIIFNLIINLYMYKIYFYIFKVNCDYL